MFPFLSAFAKLRKATISFVMSTRLSVFLSARQFAWNNSTPTDGFSCNLIFELFFFRKLSKKFNFHQNLTRIIGNLYECTFAIIYIFQFFLE